MSQLNINLTPAFEASLRRFMKARGLRTKSEAIRIAVEEGLQRVMAEKPLRDFAPWIGMARGPGEDPKPRFPTDDELWRRW